MQKLIADVKTNDIEMTDNGVKLEDDKYKLVKWKCFSIYIYTWFISLLYVFDYILYTEFTCRI